MNIKRYSNNPVLGPDRENPWEAQAVFNGCPVQDGDVVHMPYRALSYKQVHEDVEMELSTIGCVSGPDGLIFNGERTQLIKPEEEWEKFGCEDPRVTKIDDTYYIFYTALADYPHTAEGIKIAVALTKDFKTIDERHQVTHFNSKAMVLFPERINGKLVALVTMNTDNPPVRIAMITFDTPEQMWDKSHWDAWQEELDKNTLHFQRSLTDHIEIGAPPVKTDKGWVLVYSYIRGYGTEHMTFGIEVALLDLKNPKRVIGRTVNPLIEPQEKYEVHGMIPNIVFPAGALIVDGQLRIYYGGADDVCCVAEAPLDDLINFILIKDCKAFSAEGVVPVQLERFEGNPIITPLPEHFWESKYTLNPTVIYDRKLFHILYRAQNQDDTSVIGYATSEHGLRIKDRFSDPIYVPRIAEEIREEPGFSGCEDARITKMEGRFHMCYTAYNGHGPARVAYTSIDENDFHTRQWDKWEMPKIISHYHEDDKNACLVSEKINGKYMFFHRLDGKIWIDERDDLFFEDDRPLRGEVLMEPRPETWDSLKIGIAGPPLKTGIGWVLIYHSLSEQDGQYRLGAALLDLENKTVKKRLDYPILEPQTDYENNGLRPGTVFSCGAAALDHMLYVYYGGADQVVCVASVEFHCLIDALQDTKTCCM